MRVLATNTPRLRDFQVDLLRHVPDPKNLREDLSELGVTKFEFWICPPKWRTGGVSPSAGAAGGPAEEDFVAYSVPAVAFRSAVEEAIHITKNSNSNDWFVEYEVHSGEGSAGASADNHKNPRRERFDFKGWEDSVRDSGQNDRESGVGVVLPGVPDVPRWAVGWTSFRSFDDEVSLCRH